MIYRENGLKVGDKMYKNLYLKLNQIDGIGRKSILLFRSYINRNNIKLEELDNKIVVKVFEELKNIDKKVKIPSIAMLKNGEEKATKIIEDCKKHDIKIITIEDNEYPNEFKKIDTSPIVYFAKGNHDALLQDKKIAIIGTRYPTNRGKKFAYDIGQYFTERGYIIVSGLAFGCDTFGHLGCVENRGQTVAVLPSDVINIYPKKNKELAEKIIDNNGCLISEYPVGTNIQEYMFIERDRLQAALAKVVIVIETDINSGTMHTIRYTRRYNKKLACLSYPKPFEKYKQIQGNKLLLQESDVLEISSLSDLDKI